jgi:SpoIID/LytB domain protein
VVIESSAPVKVFPDGEDGSEVIGGKQWRVSLKSGVAAKQEHFVVLARQPISELHDLRKAMVAWQSRGASCRLIELGTIFGVKGKVFDNRSYILVDGPYRSHKKATRAAETYHRKHGLAKVATVAQLKKRPSGRFEAVDLQTESRIRVRDAIWFAPSATAQLTVRAKKENPRKYWGQVYVTVDRNGKLAVVNAVPADRLLAGLVPAEIFPNAPQGALRAQSVAARGELLVKIGTRHLVDPYLLCSEQHCQVYKGAGQEHPRATKAVNATKGMGLVRKDGRLVDTVYSASCGGHTENNDAAWPVEADANLRGHLDAHRGVPSLEAFRDGIHQGNIEDWLAMRPHSWCGKARFNRDRYRWTQRIPLGQIDQMVRDLDVGSVQKIRVLSRGVSGRATLIQIKGSRKTKQVRGELTIRRLFGGLRSSMFVVRSVKGANGRPAAFTFRGGGWGHGVGMCQTGAIGMANSGKSYQEILRHYYIGSQLRPLY